MRNILFRGKAIDNDKWIIGHYMVIEDFETREMEPVILPLDYDIYSYGEIDDFHFVESNTVGEWTGLFDVHNEMIFEGDILRRLGTQKLLVIEDIRTTGSLTYNSDRYEIVGNIHDDPELVGVRVRKEIIYEKRYN